MNMIKTIATALLLATVATGPVLAQSDAWSEHDRMATIPEVMQIDRVVPERSEVVIDGHTYRMYDGDPRVLEAAAEMEGRSLSLKDLKPGMEVYVMTDGIAPSAEYVPFVLGFWELR